MAEIEDSSDFLPPLGVEPGPAEGPNVADQVEQFVDFSQSTHRQRAFRQAEDRKHPFQRLLFVSEVAIERANGQDRALDVVVEGPRRGLPVRLDDRRTDVEGPLELPDISGSEPQDARLAEFRQVVPAEVEDTPHLVPPAGVEPGTEHPIEPSRDLQESSDLAQPTYGDRTRFQRQDSQHPTQGVVGRPDAGGEGFECPGDEPEVVPEDDQGGVAVRQEIRASLVQRCRETRGRCLFDPEDCLLGELGHLLPDLAILAGRSTEPDVSGGDLSGATEEPFGREQGIARGVAGQFHAPEPILDGRLGGQEAQASQEGGGFDDLGERQREPPEVMPDVAVEAE